MKERKFIVGAIGLVKKGDEILMVLRNEEINPGAHLRWEFPGGKIEFDERPEEALIREVKEETGYLVEIVRQLPITWTKVWEYPDFFQHTLILGFECRVVGEQEAFADEKVKEAAWEKIAEIDYSKTLAGTKEFVDRLNREGTISYERFREVNLKVGEILSAEPIEGSEKLLRLRVSLGTEERQILAGIAKRYTPEELIGRQIVIVANLEPKQMMGEESQGMLLAADTPDGPVLLAPERPAPPGASIR